METDTVAAARLLRPTLASAAITTVWIDPGQFGSALDLFQSHQDKRWSLTDCTSFVVMRDLGTDKAFSFDRNFEEAGVVRVPRPPPGRPPPTPTPNAATRPRPPSTTPAAPTPP